MARTLECIKKYGQRMDTEIAAELDTSIVVIRKEIAGLAASGAIVTAKVTRFEKGKPIEGLVCRLSGYAPPAAPGPKDAATRKQNAA
jgi:hypothetical protein